MIRDRQSSRYGQIMRPRSVQIRAGVLEPAASAPHERSSLTIGELAQVHEFGTSTIPARSFIRGWFDEAQQEIIATFLGQFRIAMAGKATWEQIAERCALWCAASIQKRIVAGIPPPLKPSTIARKGSSTPLIDTGVLKSSVTAEATLR